MSRYFNFFPKTVYNLDETNSSVDVVTNIMSKFSFEKSFKDNSVVFYEYLVKDGETPEMIADRVYGSAEKHWMILSLNDIVNPQTEWPLPEKSLIKLIDDRYSANGYANSSVQYAGVQWAQTHNKQYFRIETQTNLKTNEISKTTIEVDANTYANISVSDSTHNLQDGNVVRLSTTKDVKTYYEYEIEQNDEKRNIKILKPEFAPVVERELIGIFS